MSTGNLVVCPICSKQVPEPRINEHIDNQCADKTKGLSSHPVTLSSTPIRVAGDGKTGDRSSHKSIASIFTPTQPPHSQFHVTNHVSDSSSQHLLLSKHSQPSSPLVLGGNLLRKSTLVHLPNSGRQSDGEPAVKLEPQTAAFPSLPESPTPNSRVVPKRATDAITQDHEGPRPKRLRATADIDHAFATVPLSQWLRPARLEDLVGHQTLVGPDSPMMRLIEDGNMGSFILWGPPGCGKTTLARLIAKHTGAPYREFSATTTSVTEVREAVEGERKKKGFFVSKGTNSSRTAAMILFVDEIHRFSKSQQDIFLPWLESGQVQLIGATTENPSFKVNHALLSRCRTFKLDRLSDNDIAVIVRTGVTRVMGGAWKSDAGAHPEGPPLFSQPEAGSQSSVPQSSQTTLDDPTSQPTTFSHPRLSQLTSQITRTIVSLAAGDARTALSLLELVLNSSPAVNEDALLTTLKSSVSTSYDRTGDDRYEMISALHKSVRGSDGSAAMYWLARMLSQGEDPLYIARRMTVCASEDIGLADPHALPLAMAALSACEKIGMPECRINLAHIVAYLSETPKSTRSYTAYKRAEAAAKRDATLPVPLRIRNAPTALLRDMGCGAGYRYNPDYRHPVWNSFLPDELADETILKPAAEEEASKSFDEEALHEWEVKVNEGMRWEGRSEP